jgi:RNA polymerase sigma factor (sigma-70 family)
VGESNADGWPTGERLREFEEFDLAYRSMVREYLRSLGGAVPYLDDAVQDAMRIVAWRWGRLSGYDKPVAYLFMVAKQRWLKHRDHRENRSVALPPDVDVGWDRERRRPDDELLAVDGSRDALALLRPLHGRQREVAFLCYYADFDEATVAAVLGISVGSVKRLRARALARLREINRGHMEAVSAEEVTTRHDA